MSLARAIPFDDSDTRAPRPRARRRKLRPGGFAFPDRPEADVSGRPGQALAAGSLRLETLRHVTFVAFNRNEESERADLMDAVADQAVPMHHVSDRMTGPPVPAQAMDAMAALCSGGAAGWSAAMPLAPGTPA